jgi:hypothetical protein
VPLLVSKEFARHIQRPLRSLGSFELRGVKGSHEVFAVEGEDEPESKKP